VPRESPVLRTIARRRQNSRGSRCDSSVHVGTLRRDGSSALIGPSVRPPSVCGLRGRMNRTNGPRILSLDGENTEFIEEGDFRITNAKNSIFAEESMSLEKE
jgi:hypothetical protein